MSGVFRKRFCRWKFPDRFFCRNFETVFIRRFSKLFFLSKFWNRFSPAFFEDVFAAKFQNRFFLTALDCSVGLNYSKGKYRQDDWNCPIGFILPSQSTAGRMLMAVSWHIIYNIGNFRFAILWIKLYLTDTTYGVNIVYSLDAGIRPRSPAKDSRGFLWLGYECWGKRNSDCCEYEKQLRGLRMRLRMSVAANPCECGQGEKLCECGCEYLCECPRLCGCSQLCECCCKCSWLRMSQILRIFATKSGCGACGSRPAQSGRVPPNMKKRGISPPFCPFLWGYAFV